MKIHFIRIINNLCRCFISFLFFLQFLLPSGQVLAFDHSPAEIVFTENRGQIIDTEGKLRPDILYTAESGGLKIYFSKDRIFYVLSHTEFSPEVRRLQSMGETVSFQTELHRVEMQFINASPDVKITTGKKTTEHSNYYYPHCPDGITQVSSFKQITYENIYPNIDLIFKSGHGGIKYDLLVRPGANLKDIQIDYKGADKLMINQNELQIQTSLGQITENIPLVYQDDFGTKVSIGGRYNLKNEKLSFKIPSYDQLKPLIIDPWVAYKGGTDEDAGRSIATDNNNNVIITGHTRSGTGDFPTYNGYQMTKGAFTDAFVTKFDPDGIVLWSTFYGGGGIDEGLDIATDNNDTIFFTGFTDGGFPVGGVTDPASPGTGGNDGYIVKLEPTNGSRVWARLYGGSGAEYIKSIAVDGTNSVILAGLSRSNNIVPNCVNFQKPGPPGDADIIIAKFNKESGKITWSVFVGGSTNNATNERDAEVTTDPLTDNILVAGLTTSSDFQPPMTMGSWQGVYDVFIVSIRPDCSGADWGRYYGESGDDRISDITVDALGNIIITGNTSSTFTVLNAMHSLPPNPGGTNRMFISRFAQNGVAQWSTHFGGTNGDNIGLGVTTDNDANIYLTGMTSCTDFPVKSNMEQMISSNAQQKTYGGGTADAFFTKISPNGDSILCTTFLGGSDEDRGLGIALKGNGHALITGFTKSADFPATPGANQDTFSGGTNYGDAFAAQICSNCGPALAIITDSDSIAYSTIFPNDTVFICFGDSLFLLASKYGDVAWTTIPPSITSTNDSIWVKNPYLNDTVTYVLTMTSGSCTDVDMLTVIVGSAILNPNVNPDTVCIGDSITLTVSGSGSKYRWFRDDLGADTLVYDSSGFTSGPLSSDTTFYFQAYNTSGCKSEIDSVKIKVDIPPIVTLNGPTAICEGGPAIFVASGGDSYQWQDMSGNPLTTNDSLQVFPPSGIIKYYVTVTKGTCSVLDSVSVIVDTLPDITINGPVMACKDQNVTLTVTGATTYVWTNSAGTVLSNTDNVALNIVSDTIIYVEGTQGACTSRDSVMITLSTNLSDPGIQGDTIICSGISTNLTATFGSPDEVFTWYADAAGTNTIGTNPSFTTPVLTSDTIFYVKVKVDSCESNIRPVQIIVNPLPVPGVSGITTICRGDSTMLTATGGAAYIWVWPGGGANTAVIIVSPVNTTTYTVTVMNSDSCSADTNITVVTNPNPQPDAGPDRTLCKGDDTVIGTPGSATATYSWNPVTGLNDPSIAQPIASPVITTAYILTVTDNSCSDLDTIVLTVDSCSEYVSYLYVPSAFTLNGSWLIQHGNLDKYNLKVFNRWGELLFETNKPEESWDGKFNGQAIQAGAYIYVIKAVGLDEKEYNLAGTISILK